MPCDHLQFDALLLDFGGVLVSIDFNRAFASWAASAGVAESFIAERFKFDAAYAAHETAEIDTAQYFEALRRTLGISLSDQAFLVGWNSIFLDVLPGMSDLLTSLAEIRPLYLFSNTNAVHHAYWSRRYKTLLAPFSGIYCSHELGVRKPGVEAFQRVARNAGYAASRVVFFDDLEQNVIGARAAGLTAFCVTSAPDIQRALKALHTLEDERRPFHR